MNSSFEWLAMGGYAHVCLAGLWVAAVVLPFNLLALKDKENDA